MIVLDTNVLSEIIRPEPSDAVLQWLAAQHPLSVFTTAISQAEMLSGVELLPRGRRRTGLAGAISNIFAEEFAGRILPFDEEAAPAYALIVADRKRSGRPISQMDAMIAAIARTRNALIATRNETDFTACGIKALDPWTAAR